MFKLLIQLYIEKLLSGGQPYFASHPELGVPLGVFNRKDEPNHQSRVNSILKYGKQGNPYSIKLAKLFGIGTPLPSFASAEEIAEQKAYDRLRKKYRDGEKIYQDELKALNADHKKDLQEMLDSKKKITDLENKQVGLATQKNIILGKTQQFYNNIEAATTSQLGSMEQINALSVLMNDALIMEGTIRKDVVKNLGMQGKMQTYYQDNISSATVLAADAGIDFADTLRSVSSLSENIGRNLSISDETMARLAIFADATELGAEATSRLVQGFDVMGVGVDAALTKGMEMRDVASSMGLNVSKFMKSVTDNMSMVNAYNFKDGVEGFTRMAAQAQRLGLSMSDVKGLMDKVMDPEGAIELAANLQVIGGAVGDLADPFKLMFMATSDLEGLQDAMVRAGESAITFNEETGEMGISPTEMRRLKAIASELGLSYEDYVSSVKMAKKETIAMSQMNLSSFVGEDAEELKQFAASMAQFKDGKYKIELEDPDGEKRFHALEDLSAEQVKTMRESMATAQEDSAEFDAASEKDIMFRSMTALELIQKELLQGKYGFETSAGAGGQALSENVLSFVNAPGIDDFTSKIGTAVGTGMREVMTDVVTGAGDEAAVGKAFGEVVTEIQSLGENLSEDQRAFAQELITSFMGGGEQEEVKDYFTEGVTQISNSQGRVVTGSNDIIAAFDKTKMNKSLPSGAIQSMGVGSMGSGNQGAGTGNRAIKHEMEIKFTGNASLLAPNMNIDLVSLLDKDLVKKKVKTMLATTMTHEGFPGYREEQSVN